MQENAREQSGFNTTAVVLCGLALVIFLYALSLFLQGGFLAARARVKDARQVQPVNEPLQAALAEQRAILAEAPRWLDEEHTIACMPITEAMDRVVAKYGDGDPGREGGRR